MNITFKPAVFRVGLVLIAVGALVMLIVPFIKKSNVQTYEGIIVNHGGYGTGEDTFVLTAEVDIGGQIVSVEKKYSTYDTFKTGDKLTVYGYKDYYALDPDDAYKGKVVTNPGVYFVFGGLTVVLSPILPSRKRGFFWFK